MNSVKSPGTINKLYAVLDNLNDIGKSLSSTLEKDQLLSRILDACIEIANCDGGTYYQYHKNDSLEFSFLVNKSLQIRLAPNDLHQFSPIPLYIEGKPNHSCISSHCAIEKSTIAVADAYQCLGFDFSGAKIFDELMLYKTTSVVAIPLLDHNEHLLGVIQLINCLDQNNSATQFNEFTIKVVESLASQASVMIDNRIMVAQLFDMFEGVARMINNAIDEKSEYTGGHCSRVPVISELLANAVNTTDDERFANIHFDERDLYELKIASLLHDCGKITTPVHIVDKSTKLEAIFDRINLIEQRFDQIKYGLLSQYLVEHQGNRFDIDNKPVSIEEQFNIIDDDLGFIKKINYGYERLSDADLQRIQKIGRKSFYDSIKKTEISYLTDDEIANLSILSGTLSSQDREIINRHASTTIDLLNEVPWPENLKNVVEIAGGHHERMDGRGYPKGLVREQLSVRARILGIADVFEALTASDRPYKPRVSIDKCIAIMQQMADSGHIDQDLFDIFLKEQVHIKYARLFINDD